MQYDILRAELTTDPLAWGYAAMTDQAAATKLNDATAGRTRSRTTVSPAEFFGAIDDAAWPATALLQDKLRALLGQPFIDASNTRVRAIVQAIFPNSGATAATLGRLNALGTEPISRATELGLPPPVLAADVKAARAGMW